MTFTKSQFTTDRENGGGLALAPKRTWAGGLSGRHALGPGVARAGLRFYGIGDRPATDDGALVAPGFTQLDLHVGYRHRWFDVALDVENLLDGAFRSAQFATVSRLPQRAGRRRRRARRVQLRQQRAPRARAGRRPSGRALLRLRGHQLHAGLPADAARDGDAVSRLRREMVSLASGLLLGLLLGVRHALEPDHLAAVSVLVARRRNAAAGLAVGALWGAGHTLALFAVGCVLAVIDRRLPARAAAGFELLVAAMLVALGTRALVARPAKTTASVLDGHASPDAARAPLQPLFVGMIHGLAGSGALTALVVARLPTALARLLYIVLFGAGSAIGMACLTGLAGWPLAHMEASPRLRRAVTIAAAAISLLLGFSWGWAAVRGLMAA